MHRRFYVVDANKSYMSLVDVGMKGSLFYVVDAANCYSNHNYQFLIINY